MKSEEESTSPDPITRLVHADRHAGIEQGGGVHMPVHTSVQYGYERVEDLIGVFQGTLKGRFNYARQGTPTTAALEAKLTQLEGGIGGICFATGMAAVTAVLFTLLRAGDHLVASRFLFGNTISLLGTLQGLGVQVTLVDATSAQAVADALTPATRMVLVETIANPGTQVPDLPGIGALCRQRGLLYVVDNTITSPALFQPKTVGASLSVHSLTKTIAGHGNALGGAVVDTGLFDWTGYPNIFDGYRQGDPKQWGLTQLRKKALRDMGGTLSSDAAHRIAVGAETLALRTAQTSATALALATFLEGHPAVARVHYPMLASHPQHAMAKAHFSAGSWLLSFELHDADACIAVLNRLQLPVKATGMGDTRTLIIPMAPTIFWEHGAARRAELGIAEGLVRMSVGLERAGDLIKDFAHALG